MEQYGAGSFYDKYNQLIYIGGGDTSRSSYNQNDSAKIEYYNIDKDKWYDIKSPKYRYRHTPKVWKIHNVLYIAGGIQKGWDSRAEKVGIECIDLRSNKKLWTELCPKICSFQQLFKTKFLALSKSMVY